MYLLQIKNCVQSVCITTHSTGAWVAQLVLRLSYGQCDHRIHVWVLGRTSFQYHIQVSCGIHLASCLLEPMFMIQQPGHLLSCHPHVMLMVKKDGSCYFTRILSFTMGCKCWLSTFTLSISRSCMLQYLKQFLVLFDLLDHIFGILPVTAECFHTSTLILYFQMACAHLVHILNKKQNTLNSYR
jgi:hypothetical protein